MTDGITYFDVPDAPQGFPGESGADVQADDDFVGLIEHGNADHDRLSAADLGTIRSAVWGNRTAPINTTHGLFATWDPCQTGEPCTSGNRCVDRCCWYDYAVDLGMPNCTHPGMDIGLNMHTALYAAQAGQVEAIEELTSYRPMHVRIRTAARELHIYGHMWSVDPSLAVGDQIEAGRFLGTSGRQTKQNSWQPDGTGPHLHFERRLANGKADQPKQLLESANVVLHCPPSPPPPFTGAPVQIGTTTFHPDQRTVECSFPGLSARQWANRQACTTRDPFSQGEKIDVLYWIEGEEVVGEDRWWVAVDGTRLHVSGTVEKPNGG